MTLLNILEIEQKVIIDEKRLDIIDAICNVDARYLDLLLLLYDGLDKDEICERLEITSRAYDQRMVRLRQIFSEKLLEHGIDTTSREFLSDLSLGDNE